MLVIAIASQKGGSGKTTLAGHLAVEADRRGAGPVALIDTDPQGSLADWWNERSSKTPHFAHTTRESLGRDIPRLHELGMKLVLIDTPPAITSAIKDVVQVSDLVVIPTRPSPHDLRAAGDTVDLVEALGKPLVFVINAATRQAKITTEAAISLSQHGTLAPSIVHHRVDFASSMIDGRTVMELPGESRSADEIVALWAYLEGRLRKLSQGETKEAAASGQSGVSSAPQITVGSSLAERA